MYRLNAFNALFIVPLLARLVLCAAFLTAGWNKLMNTQEFRGEAATILIERGVGEEYRPTVTTIALDTPAAQDDQPVTERAVESAQDAARELIDPPPDVIVRDPVTGEQVVIAKRLYAVSLALVQQEMDGRWPIVLAWALAITELVSGALLLVGLFSRVWALALLVIMGGAIHLTSLGHLTTLGLFGVAADLSGGYAAFHQLYAQVGLFTLALAVLLTGPGPLSLDRLIFRPLKPHDPDADLPE